MIVQNHKGLNKDYWGKALERMIKENGINIGDTIVRKQDDSKSFVKVDTAISAPQEIKQADK